MKTADEYECKNFRLNRKGADISRKRSHSYGGNKRDRIRFPGRDQETNQIPTKENDKRIHDKEIGVKINGKCNLKKRKQREREVFRRFITLSARGESK